MILEQHSIGLFSVLHSEVKLLYIVVFIVPLSAVTQCYTVKLPINNIDFTCCWFHTEVSDMLVQTNLTQARCPCLCLLEKHFKVTRGHMSFCTFPAKSWPWTHGTHTEPCICGNSLHGYDLIFPHDGMRQSLFQTEISSTCGPHRTNPSPPR